MNKNFNIRFYIIALLFILVSCDQSNLEPSYPLLDSFQIRIGDIDEISGDDIRYYDQSSKLFYMNKNVNLSNKEYNLKFWFTGKQETFLDGYINYINDPCGKDTSYYQLFFGDDVSLPNYNIKLRYAVPRGLDYFDRASLFNDEGFVQQLKEEGKLMKGLAVDFVSIKLTGTNQIAMTIEISNLDSINYYYPDVDKMGNEWYSGLSIFGDLMLFDENNKMYGSNQNGATYGDLEIWNKDWLTLIKAGESQKMVINYTDFDTIVPGKYAAFFDFRGLTHHVTNASDLEREDGRVWLGIINMAQQIDLE
ncbi:MAG: hypothetical protein ACERKD_00845 [Prolixibacteraceae bacterium]